MDIEQRRKSLEAQLEVAWPDSPGEQEMLRQLCYDTPGHNSRHIRYNILSSWIGCLEASKRPEYTAEEMIAEAQRHREIHDTYVALLYDFPEYRKAEFETEEGYFPDMETHTPGSIDKYVMESHKRLRGLE